MDRNDSEHCPNCGRYPSPDNGFYAWTAAEPDFISLFCNETCCDAYEAKGGKLVDGDYWMTLRSPESAA